MTITGTEEETYLSRGIKNGSDSGTPDSEANDHLTDFSKGIYTLAEFAARDIPPLTWLVEDTVPSGGLGLLLAAEKTGKSLFAFDCGAAVATGQPFLGRTTSRTNVLVIEEEGSPAAWQYRIKKMFGDSPPDDFYFRHRMITNLNDSSDLSGLRDFIREHQIGLVFIGPLAQVGNIQEENRAEEVNSIAKALNAIVTDTGATIFIIHHRRKPSQGDKSYTLNDFFHTSRGSSALVAAVDVAVGLQRENEDPHGKMFVMLRDGPGRIDHYKMDFSTLRISPSAKPLTTKTERGVETIKQYLLSRGRPASRAEIATASELPKTTAQTCLADLVDQKQIKVIGSGRSTGYDLTDEAKALMLEADPKDEG